MSELNLEALNMLNQLLNDTDLKDVSAEGAGFEELKDGYYLAEVEKAELKTSKSSGKPMAALTLKVVENGVDVEVNEEGAVTLSEIKNSKNRKIFKYYVFKDEMSVKRFATDMLKFEGEISGEPLLPKEAFTTYDTLVDALDCLVGMRVYVNLSTSENDDGTKSTWTNLISWKRVSALELPM